MKSRKSPGFDRMKSRDPALAEKLREDTIRLQQEAIANARVLDIKQGRIKAGPQILTDIITRKTK